MNNFRVFMHTQDNNEIGIAQMTLKLGVGICGASPFYWADKPGGRLCGVKAVQSGWDTQSLYIVSSIFGALLGQGTRGVAPQGTSGCVHDASLSSTVSEVDLMT